MKLCFGDWGCDYARRGARSQLRGTDLLGTNEPQIRDSREGRSGLLKTRAPRCLDLPNLTPQIELRGNKLPGQGRLQIIDNEIVELVLAPKGVTQGAHLARTIRNVRSG